MIELRESMERHFEAMPAVLRMKKVA